MLNLENKEWMNEKNIGVIDDFDWHTFQFKIDIVIIGKCLRFSYLCLDNVKMN